MSFRRLVRHLRREAEIRAMDGLTTCRQKHTALIVERVQSSVEPLTLLDLATFIRKSVKYTHSLCRAEPTLTVTATSYKRSVWAYKVTIKKEETDGGSHVHNDTDPHA